MHELLSEHKLNYYILMNRARYEWDIMSKFSSF